MRVTLDSTPAAVILIAALAAAAVALCQPTEQVATSPASAPADPFPAVNPFARRDRFRRDDALPGVAVLSDGRRVAGGIYTTRDRSWEVWVEPEKRWRHIPPIVALSITAVVVEEGYEKEWRWKEMGSDEKVFTGRQKPIRRFEWRFHLIDDSYVTGSVKGQPVWIDAGAKRHGPFVLHERSAGEYGQTLQDLVYVKKVVISRRAMNQARQTDSRPAH